LLGFPDRETRLDLFEDFFIRLAEIGGLGRRRLGLTVLREVERQLGLADRLAACLKDPRAPESNETGTLSLSTYSSASGRERSLFRKRW
jgi:hypothetical protein